MKFINILGNKSYIKGNFFYDLHEENIFNIEAYHKLIEDISLYKVEIIKDENINKEIVSNIYLCDFLFGLYMIMKNENSTGSAKLGDIINGAIRSMNHTAQRYMQKIVIEMKS